MTPFKINTSKNGSFRVSDTSIAHYLQNTKEVSKGFLVRNHFTAVQRALFTAYFLADGKCFESIASRGLDPKEAPRLNDILDTMEWQINSFTTVSTKNLPRAMMRTVLSQHIIIGMRYKTFSFPSNLLETEDIMKSFATGLFRALR